MHVLGVPKLLKSNVSHIMVDPGSKLTIGRCVQSMR